MAEVLLKDELCRNGISENDIKVTSAGILATEGEYAMPQAIEVMKERNLSLEKHRSRRLTPEMIEEADLILTMTDSHKQSVLLMDAAGSDRVFSLAEYTAVPVDARKDVPDPYGQPLDIYRKTAAHLEDRLHVVAEKLKREMERSEDNENSHRQ
jgi:protein-tyrosine-phosphatase